MISTSSIVLIKIVIDFIHLGLLSTSYVSPIFTYDSDFDIGLIEIKYNFHADGLSAYVKSKYSEFDDHLCKSSIKETKAVCDKLERFKVAGECFVIISAFSGMLVVYGMLNLVGKIFYCTARGCLHLDFTHYLPSLITLIAFGIYSLVSDLIAISYSVQLGLVYQISSVLLSFVSVTFYLCCRKRINLATDVFNERPFIESSKPLPLPGPKDSDQELEISNPSIVSGPSPNK